MRLKIVKLTWKLNFDDCISDICKNSQWKTKCFSQNCTIYRVIQKTHTKELFKQAPCLYQNVFFNSQFNYYPLIWKCHRRTINRLFERCLRVLYSDKQSSFSGLLEKNGSVYIRMRNIEYLAILRQQKATITKCD